MNSKTRQLLTALSHVSSNPSFMKWRPLAASLLFLFLLFDSGWVWAVSMDAPTSYLLDSERMAHYSRDPEVIVSFYGYYTSTEDVAGARWLNRQVSSSSTISNVASSVCADWYTRDELLVSYGGLPHPGPSVPENFLPDKCDFREGYVYLSFVNTVYGVGSRDNPRNFTWPIAQISPEINADNVIYSNGGTTIYTYPD